MTTSGNSPLKNLAFSRRYIFSSCPATRLVFTVFFILKTSLSKFTFIWIINCYLYGATVILLVVLALLVYLRGQANHLPNPFARRNIVYRPKEKAQGVLLGKKFGLMAYSPEQDEGHILVMGPSGTGKTSALLIPTLRSW